MKVAIVHDWLTTVGGAEKVLEQLLLLYPSADLYTLIDTLEDRHLLHGRTPKTSYMQKLPGIRRYYRQLLSFMPGAMERFDLSDYDLILSSSHAVAKGVITSPDQKHICYCYTPIRYAWDMMHPYFKEAGIRKGLKAWYAYRLMRKMRQWDLASTASVDHFLTLSNFVARRIEKFYRRKAQVIYPPVNTELFVPKGVKEDFYLTASRMVPYKRMDMIVEAFAKRPSARLVVIGDGPDMAKVKAKAGSNVEILGWKSDAVLVDYMQRAKAFVFAAKEDFGILPLEANACGTPVIAYAQGGTLETIPTSAGILFHEQTAESINDALTRFERAHISPAACRENALRFSRESFRSALRTSIEALTAAT